MRDMASNPVDTPMDCRYRASPDVIAQRLGDSIILVHMQTDKIFELNRTGARLWELLTSGCSQNAARQQMLDEYVVDDAQLTGETETLIASFLSEKLLSIHDAT
jgi:hypothetical protein